MRRASKGSRDGTRRPHSAPAKRIDAKHKQHISTSRTRRRGALAPNAQPAPLRHPTQHHPGRLSSSRPQAHSLRKLQFQLQLQPLAMSSLAPHSARGEPATPARTMRSRMQRRSSLLQSVGPGAKFASASPVKPRVLFPHRGRSSLGGTSASTGTPVRLGKTGATLRRSRGRGSGLVTNAQPPPLETLDDCDEQSWWDELDDDIVPNMDLVNRLVNSLREQRKIHNHGRETAKQVCAPPHQCVNATY